jgi:hypothetical protein
MGLGEEVAVTVNITGVSDGEGDTGTTVGVAAHAAVQRIRIRGDTLRTVILIMRKPPSTPR